MNKYGNVKVVVDNIKFDSKMESNYYLYLKEQKSKNLIKDFELQPAFVLQPSFKKNNKAYRKIEYKADFKIIHNDDSISIIDIKGMETTEFKLKKKIFEYKYKDLHLKCLTYIKKYGGWIELEELQKIRRINRRKK